MKHKNKSLEKSKFTQELENLKKNKLLKKKSKSKKKIFIWMKKINNKYLKKWQIAWLFIPKINYREKTKIIKEKLTLILKKSKKNLRK